MTEAQQQFEEYWNSNDGDFDNYHYARNVAYSAWQAATTEANKRIAELEREVAIARSNENHADDQRIKCIRKYKTQITELQASNNRLREALEIARDYSIKKVSSLVLFSVIDEVMAKTPAESLQAHDNELLERAASIVQNKIGSTDEAPLSDAVTEILALKEVK